MTIDKINNLYENKWLSLVETKYKNKLGDDSSWIHATRGEQKAALIIGEIDNKLILIRQFRIPFNNYVYEFPAGLVDVGESIESTAIREFKEETGYSCKIKSISPEVSTSSGLTDETVHIVFVDVDKKSKIETNHEASEDITVELVDKKDFKNFIKQAEKRGEIIDSKLYLYLFLMNYEQTSYQG